ncbi:unnamed protein product [Protopolystoma xenopodis]|uniref:Uncharacterized protein n=1 Tax=Protopolystoma xenopodis TaxID=117903 RepID=A0A3S5B1Z5_9PLAT|nr:unnamed protein product [Protopolystoma xenopodis]
MNQSPLSPPIDVLTSTGSSPSASSQLRQANEDFINNSCQSPPANSVPLPSSPSSPSSLPSGCPVSPRGLNVDNTVLSTSGIPSNMMMNLSLNTSPTPTSISQSGILRRASHPSSCGAATTSPEVGQISSISGQFMDGFIQPLLPGQSVQMSPAITGLPPVSSAGPTEDQLFYYYPTNVPEGMEVSSNGQIRQHQAIVQHAMPQQQQQSQLRVNQ